MDPLSPLLDLHGQYLTLLSTIKVLLLPIRPFEYAQESAFLLGFPCFEQSVIETKKAFLFRFKEFYMKSSVMNPYWKVGNLVVFVRLMRMRRHPEEPSPSPRTLTRSPILPRDPIIPKRGAQAMRNFAQPVDPHKCTNYAEVFK